ncbi:hypothetical protein BX600DRAFT_448237 [Xylariales sp. PMI_506]|nr:hypothetical protein BX600DRAFT_448237 [Xylariales sp. PMI_506]
METRTSRYQSRILREMHQNKENPFNSPPSSTGSHGTVTLTSDISVGPVGESTRRMGDSIMLPNLSNRHAARPPNPSPFKVNTSAIGRDFPEWKGWDANTQEQTEDIYNVTGDYDNAVKENIPPSSSTVNSPSQVKSPTAAKSTFGTRVHLQARVEDDSDLSGNVRAPHSTRQQSPGSNKKSHGAWKPQRGNVTSLIQTLKAAQAAKESTPRKPSPRSATPEVRSGADRLQALRFSHANNTHLSPGDANQTARSFFLPNLEHINDLVSGVLRLSSVRDGIPVFVKHGKVHDRVSRSSPAGHFEIDGIEIPTDEQEIFVSLDKIREEIQALQAHDDQVSRQAEQLQEEIYELQVQLSRYRSRKDSAMGSDSESSMIEYFNSQKSQLEEKITALQAKLDKANRKISINEIHTESYVTERDEALKTATEHQEKVENLEAELRSLRRGLNSNYGHTEEINIIEDENNSLREDNNLVRAQYKGLLDENQSLRAHNTVITQQNTELQQEVKRLQQLLDDIQDDREVLQKEYEIVVEEKRVLREDHVTLESSNDKFYNDNKSLKQKIAVLERQVHDLHDSNDQLHQMLDVANAETGTVTFDIKDIRDRLERKNGNLSQENAELHQRVIELQEDFASKRMAHEQEKRRLSAENGRLSEKLDRINLHFEQIIQASREEQRASLTQQLQDIAEQEAALASQLKDAVEKETTLEQRIQQRNEVVEEVRRISKDIHSVRSAAAKPKPVKVTRILEPTALKSRSTLSETSARSATQTDTQTQDDFTQQLDLTQGSDFAELLPKLETAKLREALRKAQANSQQNYTEEFVDDIDAGITDEISQSLPPLFNSQAHRSELNKHETAAPKRVLSGILKNAQPLRYREQQDLTGQLSIKSAMSGLSQGSQATRSEVSHGRRHSDSARFDLEVEENMTSALFMDDITLDARKRASEKASRKPIAVLSKEAKRVLDSLCHDHDCRNCTVCTRINGHKHEDNPASKNNAGKKMILIEKPIPVTDRIPNPKVGTESYEDQPTVRPAQDPGVALAAVLKCLQDEVAHLKTSVAKKNAEYNALDASFGRRQRKQISSELSRLLRMLEMKNEQIYRLHDVLEGQKRSGQCMSEQEIEMTLMSIRTADDTWDGIMD